MRSRTSLFALLFAVGFFALPHLAHASIPFFGPIIPGGNNVCPAGWGMLMTVINHIIELLLTIAIVFVTPLVLAYAGFLLVFNQGDPGKVSEARKVITNTIVGIVVALAAWMIVDAVMAVLYNGPPGTWASLITSSGPECLPQKGALPQDPLDPTKTTPGVTATGGTLSPGTAAQCPSSNTACSPAVLQAAGFNAAQANAMSCIAITESSGNPYTPDSSTGACGLFQITNRPGNWSNSAFHKSPCSTTSSCNDPVCNTQTAQIMFSQQGYKPWTCAGCNAKAQNCVNTYDPGH